MMKVVLGYAVWVEYLTEETVNWRDELCASYDYIYLNIYDYKQSRRREYSARFFCNDVCTILLLKPGDEV